MINATGAKKKMLRIMEKIKCNPLACLAVFFVITVMLFNSIKSDIIQIRQEISGIYSILVPKPRELAKISPTTQKLAQIALFPGYPHNR
ncbi:MAG: hypothetical protein PHP10_03580 [Candidatus Omnitrophica bacterium]|nr:hypothetical protein [Candidatus Omnitrophota bacterium]